MFGKPLIKRETRKDVLSGKSADEFARIHTAIYNGDAEAMIAVPHSNFVFLRTNTTNEYYFAKLEEVKSIDGVEKGVIVSKIRPQALTLNVQEGEVDASAVKGSGGFVDVDVISSITKKPETIYFNWDMYAFKSNEDRKAFEEFAFEVYNINSEFKSLEALTHYFDDENFILAARERIRSNVYETEFEGGFFENTKLIKRANGALNLAVAQKKAGE